MSDFSIYSYYQLLAIEGKLNKTDVAFEKKVRRWYAKELRVAFDATFKIPWTDIISHYYDDQIEEAPYNAIYDMAVTEYLPEVAKAEEVENQAYADSLVQEQKESYEKYLKKNPDKKRIEEPKKEPTQEDIEKKEAERTSVDFDMGNPDE